jgi:hypothetical protein
VKNDTNKFNVLKKIKNILNKEGWLNDWIFYV